MGHFTDSCRLLKFTVPAFCGLANAGLAMPEFEKSELTLKPQRANIPVYVYMYLYIYISFFISP